MALPTDYLREVTEPTRTALMMWDFQVGLGGRAFDLESLVAANRRLLKAADAAGVPVFWSRHTLVPPALETPGLQCFMMHKQGAASVNDIKPFMLVGSPEREFLADLQPREHDTVIDKTTPSFFVGTPLGQRLLAAGRTTLVFTGVATEIGVDLSAKHALALGYVPVVVEDAVGSYTVERKEIGLAALRTWIPVLTAEEIIGFWETASRE
jgi:nicotinamidase-related amidase